MIDVNEKEHTYGAKEAAEDVVYSAHGELGANRRYAAFEKNWEKLTGRFIGNYNRWIFGATHHKMWRLPIEVLKLDGGPWHPRSYPRFRKFLIFSGPKVTRYTLGSDDTKCCEFIQEGNKEAKFS